MVLSNDCFISDPTVHLYWLGALDDPQPSPRDPRQSSMAIYVNSDMGYGEAESSFGGHRTGNYPP